MTSTQSGKVFEDKTDNSVILTDNGYSKTNKYGLSKQFEDRNITFLTQYQFKKYVKSEFNIEVFRCPDEAYIIEYTDGKKVVKIIEKKFQNVHGSVETKLWSAPSLKREYELVFGSNFEVVYGFCVSLFLQNKITSNDKKYQILNTILQESNIEVLYGDTLDYFTKLEDWINS